MSDWPTAFSNVQGGVIHSASLAADPSDAYVLQSNFVTGAAAWPAANDAIFIPFTVGATCTAYKIGWVNGATVAGNVDVGLYTLAGVKIVSTGSVAMSGVSVAQFGDIADTVLNPGNYFMAMASNSATATFDRLAGVTAAAIRCYGVQKQATAFALPATATFAAPTATFYPSMCVTLNSTS